MNDLITKNELLELGFESFDNIIYYLKESTKNVHITVDFFLECAYLLNIAPIVNAYVIKNTRFNIIKLIKISKYYAKINKNCNELEIIENKNQLKILQ
jgi:hypothetical protein